MKEYREQLVEKIEELKQEFESIKEETATEIANATPNKMTGFVSSYSSAVSELYIVAGKINALQEQLRAFDYYNKEN